MLTEDGRNLYVSNDEYHRLVEKLAIKIHQSGWSFDFILCLARGGLRPGDIFSRLFRKPLAIMAASVHRTVDGDDGMGIDIARFVTIPKGDIAGKVLLVDDLADTGITLSKVTQQLRGCYPAIVEVRSAVIWTKAVSQFKPDYCVEVLPTNPWIHQPFEVYDNLQPEQLRERWSV